MKQFFIGFILGPIVSEAIRYVFRKKFHVTVTKVEE